VDKLGVSLPWLITQTVNFLIVLWVLQRFAYKPLLGMMERRKTDIANALSNAERVRQEAAAQQAEFQKQLDASRREGQEAIARATAQSEKVRQDIIAKANEEAAQIKAKAMADAEYERKQALSQLQGEIANLSLAMTRKVLGGGALDEGQHRQLVQQFLADIDQA
jgi:F-type H+-transporting ATPase subunit b